jgi:hypothetical protein
MPDLFERRIIEASRGVEGTSHGSALPDYACRMGPARRVRLLAQRARLGETR